MSLICPYCVGCIVHSAPTCKIYISKTSSSDPKWWQGGVLPRVRRTEQIIAVMTAVALWLKSPVALSRKEPPFRIHFSSSSGLTGKFHGLVGCVGPIPYSWSSLTRWNCQTSQACRGMDLMSIPIHCRPQLCHQVIGQLLPLIPSRSGKEAVGVGGKGLRPITRFIFIEPHKHLKKHWLYIWSRCAFPAFTGQMPWYPS